MALKAVGRYRSSTDKQCKQPRLSFYLAGEISEIDCDKPRDIDDSKSNCPHNILVLGFFIGQELS